MTDYDAAQNAKDSYDLAISELRARTRERNGDAMETAPPVSRTATVVPHPDFGAAVLVTDGSGKPFYVPKDKTGLVQLILDAARVLRELP
jgi:hypothetical protein